MCGGVVFINGIEEPRMLLGRQIAMRAKNLIYTEELTFSQRGCKGATRKLLRPEMEVIAVRVVEIVRS